MKKRILALVVSILILVTVCPIASLAGTAVAQIGSTSYESLAAAIAAVPTDGTATTITMVADETYTTVDPIKIDGGKNIILDLNGKVLTYNSSVAAGTSDAFITLEKGKLTIDDSQGNGKITANKPSLNWSAGHYTINVMGVSSGSMDDSVLIVNAGTIENSSTASGLAWPINVGAWGKYASATINGGTIKSANYVPIRLYLQYGGAKQIVINGGTFDGSNSRAVAIQFNDQVVQESAANLIINDGTFNAGGSGILYMDLHANNLDTSGVNCVVMGGSFTGDTSKPVVAYDNEGRDQSSAVLLDDFICGGTFNVRPEDDDVVDGLSVVEEDGLYTVGLPAIEFRLPTDATDDTKAANEVIQETAEEISKITKDEDTKLEDAIDESALIEQAGKGDVLVTTFIDVGLVSASKEDEDFTEITFDVTPIAVILDTGTKEVAQVVIPNELIGTNVTVRLPLPDSFKGKTVRVLHEGEFLCDTEVLTNDAGCYVEFETGSFSKYSVIEAPETPEPAPTPTPTPTPEPKIEPEHIADTADSAQAIGSVAFGVASLLCIAAIEKRKRED